MHERPTQQEPANTTLAERHDAAVLELGQTKLAFTADSFVVDPLFFRGGDISSLAVHGTVNDLTMSGARPLYLSATFVLEEGLDMETLWRVVHSMQAATVDAGVRIVTGNTKVVDRGEGDGVYINTSGVGIIEHDLRMGPESVRPGDVMIVNGDIGRHGMAIMAQRKGLQFESAIDSDSASVGGLVNSLFEAGIDIHCKRDLTRGGFPVGFLLVKSVPLRMLWLRAIVHARRDPTVLTPFPPGDSFMASRWNDDAFGHGNGGTPAKPMPDR